MVENSKGWLSVGLNGNVGSYLSIQRDCDGNRIGEDVYRYRSIGGNISYNFISSPNNYLRTGVNYYYLEEDLKVMDDGEFRTYYIGSLINPFLQFDTRVVGIGAGVHIPLVEDNYLIGYITPVQSFYIRLGNRAKFFWDMGFMNNYYENGAYGKYQMGLGCGFDELNKSKLRFGLGLTPQNRAVAYFSGNILIEDFLFINPSFSIGDKFSGSLGVQHHFGKNKWVARHPNR